MMRVADFEAAARERLPQMVFDYYAGGAGDELTLVANRAAFDRWQLRPRVLVDVSAVDVSTVVFGEPVALPVLIAPVALQRMAHREGELATARAAADAGTIMLLSTIATHSIEDVAAVGGRRWFQLYVHRDRGLTLELVRRAEAAGYTALAVTVDAPLLGRRYRDERNAFTLPPGLGLANLMGMSLPAGEGSGLFAYFQSQLDASLTWDDLAWLRSQTSLRLLLKGVLTAEDGALAAEAGMDGVVVSNHGGRQLDGATATIDALPEVVDAVDGRAEVLLDGGIRRGEDVLKALALGARAVLAGRAILWGLAVDGEAGVRRILEILREELVLAMALAGRPSVASLDRTAVAAPR